MNGEEVDTGKPRSPVRERLACSVILVLVIVMILLGLLVILMLTGTLKLSSSSAETSGKFLFQNYTR